VAVGADHAIFYVPAVGKEKCWPSSWFPKGDFWAFALFLACTAIQLRSR
jgi:hypothetical protein